MPGPPEAAPEDVDAGSSAAFSADAWSLGAAPEDGGSTGTDGPKILASLSTPCPIIDTMPSGTPIARNTSKTLLTGSFSAFASNVGQYGPHTAAVARKSREFHQ